MISEESRRIFLEQMSRKTCDWPYCGCYQSLAKWKEHLIDDEETILNVDQLEWAEIDLFASLACMTKYCPDKKQRAYATKQLRDRFWDRQWSMSKREH